ncbi:MAG: hypothetical protein LBF60_00535 [Treponema sp.]|nr:hypothetical protein [Treponema sp.]
MHVLNWRIAPSAGFACRNRKWTAQDGFLQYPASGLWTGEDPKQELYGAGRQCDRQHGFRKRAAH